MIKTPLLATDAIVECDQKIVLIKRKNPPYGYAFPGGFVDVGESVENACLREMKEELNVDIKILNLLGVYSDPSRDERFHCASVVFIGTTKQTPIAGDDAKEVLIVKPENALQMDLVFDHKKILNDYIKYKDSLDE